MAVQLIDMRSLTPCACCGEAADQLARYGDGRLYCPECPPPALAGSPAAVRTR